MRSILLGLALGVCLCAVTGVPTHAATFIVDTTVDDASKSTCDAATPSDCSLRGAVARARSTAGSNTVEVPAGTYVLTQSTPCPWRVASTSTAVLNLTTIALCLGGDTTVVGAGAGVTVIDAAQPAGNFNTLTPVALVSALANVELRGVTLKRGNFSYGASTWGTGGGIRTSGNLLLADSAVEDNYTIGPGGGIYNTGALSLLRTRIARNTATGDGGGIFNGPESTLSVADSHILDNAGVNGGGISNLYGDATVTGSTISGNTGFSFGGGVYNGSFRTMFLTNTTVSGNRGRSAGGIYSPQSSTVHLQNVTITANTARWFDNPSNGIAGGVYANVGTITLANTIVAGNVAAGGTGPDCVAYPQYGGLTSRGYNLIGNTLDCSISGDATGNVLGQSALLGVLTQNGGPTPTHAPADGSPAIDAGNPATPGAGGTGTCVATDQRGFVRPLGPRCDIGAFERGGAFAVASILPAAGGSSGTVSALVSGSGFVSGAAVVLRRAGHADVAGSAAVVDAGGSAIAVTFDLAAKPAGAWDVVVVNPDQTSRTLAAGFTIEAGRTPELWVDVVGLVRRPGRPSMLTIVYGNRGNTDALGVPLWLSVPKGYGVSTLFAIAPPPAQAGEVRPDWSAVAPVLLTEATSGIAQVPLLLPVVPAGFTGILRLALTLPLDAQDSLILAVIGEPVATPALDARFVSDTVAGAAAHVQRNFALTVPAAVLPSLEQYLAGQLDAILQSGRATFNASLGTQTEVYSLAHLSLDLALFAVVRAADASSAERPADTWLARIHRWVATAARRTLTALVAWLGPTEAWAAGGTRGQSCGMVLGEGQSGCGGQHDNLRDILPPEIPLPPGCDPSKPREFVANKCVPSKDMCESLPGYRVVTGQGGQPFCVPENPPKRCSQLIDNPILGGSGNLGCKIFPLRPTNSADPNEKVGAVGVGQSRHIPIGVPLGYTIHFENLPTATGAAQVVSVIDQLDPDKVDLDTFRLGPITFGTLTLVPAPGVQAYTGSVDLRPDQNLVVTVNAGLDPSTGIASWQFVSVDPDTGQLTEDVEAGFLPPNTAPPQGEGSVVFTVMPRSGVATGTQITNQARIYFDLNAPIDTPVWLNTVDGAGPTSRVLPLATAQSGPTFAVQWSGEDAGSGVAGYTIFVSKDGGAPVEFRSDTAATSAAFTGQPGSTYVFCSLARDQAGNVESKACPGVAEAVTTVAGGHDLAVVKIAAPKTVSVAPGSSVTKPVTVRIQNRSRHTETLDAAVLGNGTTTGLVRLSVDMVDDDGEGCQPPVVTLDAAKAAAMFRQGPKLLKSKAKLAVGYLVTYSCTTPGPRNTADATPGDYRYTATVHHEAIDGQADTHPLDDTCPRLPLGIDPHPDGKIKDQGCGARTPDGLVGAPVVTNVLGR